MESTSSGLCEACGGMRGRVWKSASTELSFKGLLCHSKEGPQRQEAQPAPEWAILRPTSTRPHPGGLGGGSSPLSQSAWCHLVVGRGTRGPGRGRRGLGAGHGPEKQPGTGVPHLSGHCLGSVCPQEATPAPGLVSVWESRTCRGHLQDTQCPAQESGVSRPSHSSDACTSNETWREGRQELRVSSAAPQWRQPPASLPSLLGPWDSKGHVCPGWVTLFIYAPVLPCRTYLRSPTRCQDMQRG